MVRNILPVILLAVTAFCHTRAWAVTPPEDQSLEFDTPVRPRPGRARITVLPAKQVGFPKGAPPDFIVTAGPDVWFSEGGDRVVPGASVARDWFLTEGPVRLTLFIDGGGVFTREDRLEERAFTRDVGGEEISFLSIILVEEERISFSGSAGLALAFEGRWAKSGFYSASVGGGGALMGRRGGGMVRGSIFAGWREGLNFVGVRVGADGRWTDGFEARLSLGIALGIAFR